MVIIFGGTIGAEEGVLRERLTGMEMVFWDVAASSRSSAAARWMNSWPSSQKAWTYFSTL